MQFTLRGQVTFPDADAVVVEVEELGTCPHQALSDVRLVRPVDHLVVHVQFGEGDDGLRLLLVHTLGAHPPQGVRQQPGDQHLVVSRLEGGLLRLAVLLVEVGGGAVARLRVVLGHCGEDEIFFGHHANTSFCRREGRERCQ